MALVSVVMPCFNGAAHIKESIESVLAQTFTDLELIIIDDGSVDGSSDIVRDINDDRIRLIVLSTNSGVCAARNAGIESAQGEYLAFLDSDDTWSPEFLMDMVQTLSRSDNAVLVYCGWQNLGLPGGRGKPFIPPDYDGEKKIENLLFGCRWPIHAALTHTSTIRQAGGFDEKYVTSEDYYLWLRVAVLGDIIRLPRVLAYYRHHEGVQATKNQEKVAIQCWQVQHLFLDAHPELINKIGAKRVREIVEGGLLKKGYRCYWARDLCCARRIFRIVMRQRYGSLNDWKYMCLALLPLFIHQRLIEFMNRIKGMV